MTAQARRARPAPGWGGELRGGLNATVAMLPFVLVYGAIAFAALGPAGAAAGLAASLASVAGGGLLMALLGRATPLPAAAPSVSSCLILGAAVTGWVHPQRLPAHELAALVGATVAAAGLGYLVLGALRVGSLVAQVPRPVLAGFVNGIALLIAWSQLPALLGLAHDALRREGPAAWAHWQAAPLVVGVATAGLMVAVRSRWPRAPAALLALLAATAAVVAVQALLPGMLPPLSVVGALVPELPGFVLGEAVSPLRRHAGEVFATAALLALVGTLESVLNLAAVEQQLRTRSDPNRTLLALGACNLVLGTVGALPVVYLRLRALATRAGGGRSARALVAGSLMTGAVVLLAAPLGAWLPQAVLAGIVLVLAWSLVDAWSLGLLQRERTGGGSLPAQRGEAVDAGDVPSGAAVRIGRRLSLAVTAIVCVVTLVWGFVAGVALGLLLSFALLVHSLRRSLVRSRSDGAQQPSRRVYPPDLEAALARARPGIDVIELEGTLFFGNAERLRQEVERAPDGAAPRWAVVLDLRRVSTIDASAAVALAALHDELDAAGVALLLAGVTPGNRHGVVLAAHGAPTGGAWRTHPDTDLAVEAAERIALERAGLPTGGQAVPLQRTTLFEGLGAADAARLSGLMPARSLAAGEALFRQGDPGDALYLLVDGSITVRDARSGQRFVSFSPGMCLGETAVLDGRGRTADAVADRPSTVHRLATADLAKLLDEAPALAARVHGNLARHLAARLRDAAAAWRRAAT
ncbi:MAG: SLC26A/SulP transporter family protein [Rubrivivax sp.]|nr:SLC26A/SulP transporter family protein [Rubrivivax sp.]